MLKQFVDMVYDLVNGSRICQPNDPKVENLFDEGRECALLYDQVYEANLRLCQRLGAEEDADVEMIINSLIRIGELVGKRMFYYGMEFKNELQGEITPCDADGL